MIFGVKKKELRDMIQLMREMNHNIELLERRISAQVDRNENLMEAMRLSEQERELKGKKDALKDDTDEATEGLTRSQLMAEWFTGEETQKPRGVRRDAE